MLNRYDIDELKALLKKTTYQLASMSLLLDKLNTACGNSKSGNPMLTNIF